MTNGKAKTPSYNSIGFETKFSEHAFVLFGDNGETARAIGTGFFIAPNLALTARHVMDDFWEKYNPRVPLPSLEEEVETNYKVFALQFLGDKIKQALWYAETTWRSDLTNISFLHLKPVEGTPN